MTDFEKELVINAIKTSREATDFGNRMKQIPRTKVLSEKFDDIASMITYPLAVKAGDDNCDELLDMLFSDVEVNKIVDFIEQNMK